MFDLFARPGARRPSASTRGLAIRPACRRGTALAAAALVAMAATTSRPAPSAAMAAPLQDAPADSNPVVVLETSKGDIVIELDAEQAPITTANFLELVRSGFYDEIVFHRIIREKVVQAGMLDMEGQVRGLDVEPIENEAPNRVHNGRGTIAMARTDDPHSATTQFFINVRDNWEYNFSSFAKADYGYAVFGRVIEGMDVVDEIADIPTRRIGQLRDFPEEIVAVYRAYVLEGQ